VITALVLLLVAAALARRDDVAEPAMLDAPRVRWRQLRDGEECTGSVMSPYDAAGKLLRREAHVDDLADFLRAYEEYLDGKRAYEDLPVLGAPKR
jgi:hypothetical protein